MTGHAAVRSLSAREARGSIPALSAVLIDCVEGGASVGFMAPLAREKADAFWRGVAGGVAAGERILLVAEDRSSGAIAGTRSGSVRAAGEPTAPGRRLQDARPPPRPQAGPRGRPHAGRRRRRKGRGQDLARARYGERRCGAPLRALGVDAGRPGARLRALPRRAALRLDVFLQTHRQSLSRVWRPSRITRCRGRCGRTVRPTPGRRVQSPRGSRKDPRQADHGRGGEDEEPDRSRPGERPVPVEHPLHEVPRKARRAEERPHEKDDVPGFGAQAPPFSGRPSSPSSGLLGWLRRHASLSSSDLRSCSFRRRSASSLSRLSRSSSRLSATALLLCLACPGPGHPTGAKRRRGAVPLPRLWDHIWTRGPQAPLGLRGGTVHRLSAPCNRVVGC